MNQPHRLLLDVGNSRLKWVLADDAGLSAVNSLVHMGDPAAVLERTELPDADEIWIADVVGGVPRIAMTNLLKTRYGCVPHFATVRATCSGLACAYARPARLGVDRWLMSLAAWMEMRQAVCVASVGTAVTFDAVESNGRHLGGCIVPGLMAMQQAVLATTRFAAGAPQQDYSDGLGSDTEACVQQGALHAIIGLLDRLAARYGSHGRCWLTGGDAPRLLPHLGEHWRHRPALVLEGLLSLANSEARAQGNTE